MNAPEALLLFRDTRDALASLNPNDPGIQAALTIGWEDTTQQPQKYRGARPREWSPREGGSLTESDIKEILVSMREELEQSDRNNERDVTGVALMVLYRSLETLKKGLRRPDWKFLRSLAIEDFTHEEGRKPKLKSKA